MSNFEEDKQKIIDAAAKLQKGIDAQLEETEYEDQEVLQVWQESYGETQEMAQKVQQAQYRQRLRSIKRDPQFMQALQKRGLTAEKFVALEAKNPHAYAEVYSQGVESYLDRLQGKTGKGQQDPFFEDRMARPAPALVDKAKEKSKQRDTHKAMGDAFLALLGFEDD